ncbi:MAG: hypothetical protein WC513_09500, partial [Bacteroidales bacterium]
MVEDIFDSLVSKYLKDKKRILGIISGGKSTYLLSVPAEDQKRLERKYGRNKTLAMVEIAGFELANNWQFTDEHFEGLSQRLEQLRRIVGRAPPRLSSWKLVVTTDLNLTQGNVASCRIDAGIVFIHPYFFQLPEFHQIEILYHELISHIARGIEAEENAMADTRINLFLINWQLGINLGVWIDNSVAPGIDEILASGLLTEKEKFVLKARLGMIEEKKMPFREIAQRIGLKTPGGVRAVLSRAVAKTRYWLVCNGFNVLGLLEEEIQAIAVVKRLEDNRMRAARAQEERIRRREMQQRAAEERLARKARWNARVAKLKAEGRLEEARKIRQKRLAKTRQNILRRLLMYANSFGSLFDRTEDAPKLLREIIRSLLWNARRYHRSKRIREACIQYLDELLPHARDYEDAVAHHLRHEGRPYDYPFSKDIEDAKEKIRQLNAYPLIVPADAQQQAQQRYGQDWTSDMVEVNGFNLDYRQQFMMHEHGILKEMLGRLEQAFGRAPPELASWRLAITTDLDITCRNVAACDINNRIVYLHPYFFTLEEGKQIEILYHELISHIVHNERNEDKAEYDTRRFSIAAVPFMLYNKGLDLLWDNKHSPARYLFHIALANLPSRKDNADTDSQAVLETLRSEIKALISSIEENANYGLERRSIQTIDPESAGLDLARRVSFLEAHNSGIWHANAQVLVVDQKGRAWMQLRPGTIKRFDLAATGHLFLGDTFEKAALTELQRELGLFRPQSCSLVRLSEVTSGRKISKNTYKGRPTNTEGVFCCYSQEKDNHEYAQFFLYVLSQDELDELESEKYNQEVREALGIKPVPLVDAVAIIQQHPEKCGSAANQLFYDPVNVELILRRIQETFTQQLRAIADNPTAASREYIEDVKTTLSSIIAQRRDWRTQRELEKGSTQEDISKRDPQAINKRIRLAKQEVLSLYEKCVILATWQRLREIFNRDLIDGLHLAEALRLMGTFGRQARGLSGRSLLTALLMMKDINLKAQDKTGAFSNCVFVDSRGQQLPGVEINKEGELKIAKSIKNGLRRIRHGAIAADMDRTTAKRDENIDSGILNLINQLLMLGIYYAVASGNEFNKQYRRSLTELTPEELLDSFVIYANGAGLKGVYATRHKEFRDDRNYTKIFTGQQKKTIRPILEGLAFLWSKVICAIRENREMLRQKQYAALAGLIGQALNDDQAQAKNRLFVSAYNVDVVTNLLSNMETILQQINEVLISEPQKEEDKKYKANLEEQLNPAIPESELRKKKNWPYVDERKNIKGEMQDNPQGNVWIQFTLKPIYPTKKPEGSAREIVALIIEEILKAANAQIHSQEQKAVPLKKVEGGSTSVDVVRNDADKASAAEDLIKQLRLEGERDLILAIGDEMDPAKVDFPFLTVAGISVLSVETTKTGVKREYKQKDAGNIKATWFWSKELGWGTELEATRKAFAKLRELYIQEVRNLFSNNAYVPEPAMRRLKQYMGSGTMNTYPLPVPAEAQKKAVAFYGKDRTSETRYGQDWLSDMVEVNGFNLDYRQQFMLPEHSILKDKLKRLEQLLGRAPPLGTWRLFLTTDLSLTQGNVAACDIDSRAVFIHPYFFELDENLQLDILYHELISHIAKGIRKEEEAMQDTILNTLAKDNMRQRFERLYGVSKEEALKIDPYLAKIAYDDADKKEQNRLGWVIANVDWLLAHPQEVESVIADAKTILSLYEYVIICGMGGSGLSVQVVKTTFGEKKVKIYSLRTTDPAVIADILEDISRKEGSLKAGLEKTLVIAISKSGTTQETVSHKKYFEDLYAKLGLDIKKHMWVVTDQGSPMDTGDYKQR